MKKINKKTYGLIPPQETISFMLKYSLHKQVTQIASSVIVKDYINFELMKKALNIEIERNDCMRLRFFKEDGATRQYFIDSYTVDKVPVMSFALKQNQLDTLTADAQKPIRPFKDETFRVIFFRSYDGRYGVYFNVSHLIMDANAVFLFYGDLFAVYDALCGKREMPAPLGSYADMLEKDLAYVADKERVSADREFYKEYFLSEGEPFYAGVHGTNMLEKARKKTKNPNLRVPSVFDPIHDKASMIHRRIDSADAKKLLDFCRDNYVSPECLVQLGMRTHVSAINYRTPDVYFMMLCNRRSTLKEKRTGGTTAQPLPSRCVIDESLTFREALGKIAGVQSQLFRHLDYPYMASRQLCQELFNYGMAASPACMMLSWFPIDANTVNGREYEFTGYSLGRYVLPLYSFAMRSVEDNSMKFAYLYRENMISENDINRMHDNAVKVMLAGVENPDITIGELLDSVE